MVSLRSRPRLHRAGAQRPGLARAGLAGTGLVRTGLAGTGLAHPGLAFVVLTLLVAGALQVLPCAAAGTPLEIVTAKRPVTDEYHGRKMVDEYRWLETWDGEVQAWSDAQNAAAREHLDALPSREAIRQRLTELLSSESPSYSGLVRHGDRFFARKKQPPREQPFIVALEGIDPIRDERVVVDPNLLDHTGATSFDWFVPSHDGRFVAVSLSKNGTEDGEVHVFEAATGRELVSDIVPRVNSGTAGGTLAWKGDGSGFWYTRHPAPGERAPEDMGFYQQVFFHRLGAPVAEDTYSLGHDLPRIAENFLESSEDGRFVLDLVQKGDGGEYELYLCDLTKVEAGTEPWIKTASYEDGVFAARFGPDGAVWLLSRGKEGLGALARLEPGATDLRTARTVVPEGPLPIEAFEVTASQVWVIQQMGGPQGLKRTTLAGEDLGLVPVLPVSSVGGLTRGSGDEVFFSNESFIQPSAWYQAGADGQVVRTALVQTSPADLSGVEVLRLNARSKDGASVPLTVLVPRHRPKQGKTPALLTAYGGFGISNSPGFNRDLAVWLEQGCIWALGNVRGGGEFGEAWHQGGYRTNKQNVFDDFAACAEKLIEEGFTDSAHLAITGGSNGGLLMGAAMTQRPDLFKTVVAEVGLFDMLRYETKPNGVFNTTEYGSVADPAEFRALAAYSPFHRIQDGRPYPPVLLMTGANDPRVDPMHSRKMAARLQAAGSEAYLRTSGSTGHGIGTPLSEEILEKVDFYSFLFAALGVNYTTGAK